MTTQYTTNFAVPSTSNMFQCIWKLTRTMKAAGWTTQASSDSVNKDTSGTQSADKWGGNASPLADTYPANGLADTSDGGWIVMRGPSTLKLPLNANPTGTFIRGETITQATSLAEGEIVGYVWDSVGLTGWMVIRPHTGSFDMTHTITGASSGATAVPLSAGTLVTLVREIVFARDTSSVANAKINGWIWYICADASAESAQLPTNLATQSGCTASVPPGGGGTSNAFPTRGLIIKGTTSLGYTGWLTSSTTTFSATNNAQMFCANATPTTGVSADGSFYLMLSNTAGANETVWLLFTAIDDSEPGDCDPYAWGLSCSSTSVTSFAGTTNTSSAATATPTLISLVFFGYAARLCPQTTRDNLAVWAGTALYFGSQGSASYAVSSLGTSNLTLLNHPSTTPPAYRESISLTNCGGNSGITNFANSKGLKGRCRWLQMITVGNTYDTYDSKNWIVMNVGSSSLPTTMLPYDGASTPTQ